MNNTNEAVLRDALEAMIAAEIATEAAGDNGTYEVEEMPVIIQARAALASTKREELTDADIERHFYERGGRWDGSLWVIEDADLHPMFRSFVALAATATVHDSDCSLHNEPAYPAGPCDCSVATATVAKEGGLDATAEWRRLAHQYDGHRMQALWHLKAMLQDAAKHAPVAAAFLAAPPSSTATPKPEASADDTFMLKREIHNLKRHIEDYCPAPASAEQPAGEVLRHEREMAAYTVACKYGHYESEAFKLVDEMFACFAAPISEDTGKCKAGCPKDSPYGPVVCADCVEADSSSAAPSVAMWQHRVADVRKRFPNMTYEEAARNALLSEVIDLRKSLAAPSPTGESLSARDAALEEAAADVESKKVGVASYFEIDEHLQEAADAIRALKTVPGEPT